MLRPFPTRYRWRHRRGRPLRVEPLESRRLLAAAPLGATVEDTGEFLLGSVAVTPVFFESDGSVDEETQDWSGPEIDQMLAKIGEGVNWWSEALAEFDSVHSLDFLIDDTYAADPFETPFEPIDRTSDSVTTYVGDFYDRVGYGEADSLEAKVHRFNHDQRLKLGTDWAFTLFVADSSDDDDGKFAEGGSFRGAFAFPGGQFFITPSTRPASTIAHELGHIFWARDEYVGGGSWTDQRGYYNAQNLNAADNPTPGFEQEISIMRGGVPLAEAYDQHVSPESTLAMVGWRDSDGDGIFDVADVPLGLEATGYIDADTSQYQFTGSASAVPLPNQNSWGHQSDITLGRISRLQYSLDGGPWVTAAEPDAQTAEFDLSVDVPDDFSSIRWRVIDDATGVTSETIEGTAVAPAASAASARGYAFLDSDTSGTRAEGEPLLAGTTVTLRAADGSPLFGGSVQAADFAESTLPETVDGAAIGAEGTLTLSGEVGAFASTGADGRQIFQAYDEQFDAWWSQWTARTKFTAEFDQPVGEVSIEAIGLGQTSYGRLEAYDAAGNLIARSTTDSIEPGAVAMMEVSDASARIARIRAFGHASTSIALTGLEFGFPETVVTGPSGSWSLPNLRDGEYQLELQPELVIHQFDQPVISVEVTGGSSPVLQTAARRVPSPRYNLVTAEDVDGNDELSALDALLVINDLSRNGDRALSAQETEGSYIDVNNDGHVSAVDALLVINALSRADSTAGGEGERAGDHSATAAVGSSGTETRLAADASRTDDPVMGDPVAADHVFAAWPETSVSARLAAGVSGRPPVDGSPSSGRREMADFVGSVADQKEWLPPVRSAAPAAGESRSERPGAGPRQDSAVDSAPSEIFASKLAGRVKPEIPELFAGRPIQ